MINLWEVDVEIVFEQSRQVLLPFVPVLQGILKGRQEGEKLLIIKLLTRKIGVLSPSLRSQIESLSLPQLEALGESLLDFSSPDDLTEWLQGTKPAL